MIVKVISIDGNRAGRADLDFPKASKATEDWTFFFCP